MAFFPLVVENWSAEVAEQWVQLIMHFNQTGIIRFALGSSITYDYSP